MSYCPEILVECEEYDVISAQPLVQAEVAAHNCAGEILEGGAVKVKDKSGRSIIRDVKAAATNDRGDRITVLLANRTLVGGP